MYFDSLRINSHISMKTFFIDLIDLIILSVPLSVFGENILNIFRLIRNKQIKNKKKEAVISTIIAIAALLFSLLLYERNRL